MGVCFYYLLGYPPNWKIAISRTQKYIPERVIKIILAFLIFIPAAKYILRL
ncbi:MAG: hypothetical protein LWW95_03110 [Candidatus Desulfofervidus auxilii]|nr:hypothetical protein [Candidatus Desulfofervidus auxilii]